MNLEQLYKKVNKLDIKAYKILVYFGKKEYKKFINSKQYVSAKRKLNEELNKQIGLLHIRLKTNK